jgi:hypothetical protein
MVSMPPALATCSFDSQPRFVIVCYLPESEASLGYLGWIIWLAE